MCISATPPFFLTLQNTIKHIVAHRHLKTIPKADFVKAENISVPTSIPNMPLADLSPATAKTGIPQRNDRESSQTLRATTKPKMPQ
jgi:hypothetical protein